MLAGWGRSGTAAALMTVLGLAIAGCAGSPEIAAPTAARPATTQPGRPVTAGRHSTATWVAPLTGLPAASARAANRPAVALPLAGARVHGLAAADVVFEEITTPIRYIAVFQSREDPSVGPVTGTRPTDGQALSVLHPLIGYDGGTLPFIRVLDRTDVVDVGVAHYPALYHPGATGPIVSTSQVAAAAHGTAPPPLFSYQGSAVGSQARFATTGSWPVSWLRVAAPGLGPQQWVFSARSGRWTNVAGGPRVQAANVIVQTVPYKEVNLSARLGIKVPSARVIGAGRALVLSGTTGAAGHTGVAVHAAWSKPGSQQVTNYLDARSTPVGLQPGPTWVILAPAGTRISTGRGRS